MSQNDVKIPPSFELVEKERVEEVASDAWIFKHKKTQARCIFLKNNDDNRVFFISFQTPPSDHTGVFHILEHSVLCGSKKYPVKEPFIELAKGSLNTFLNAMTFPDKTIYPVASRNIVDFRNLVDVYLDAVFYPNIYQKKEIFYQEGWHYVPPQEGQPLGIQGIVYNEMKGAYSSPEQLLFNAIFRTLFPNTIYQYESGGNPEHIPSLTYEQFIGDHQKYYHPSNSHIYLYGDLDIAEWLEYMDKEYLSHYSAQTIEDVIALEQPFQKSVRQTLQYPIGPEDSEKNKTYHNLSLVVGKATDSLQYMSVSILEHILLGTQASPLKKALMEADIAEEISGFVDLNIQQMLMGILAKNSNPEHQETFLSIIQDTLKSLSANGIDPKLIEASVNIHEFQLREADYRGFPKGLFYGMSIMDSWLYKGKPTAHLAFNDTLKTIREKARDGYFEQLIEEMLINNPHRAELMMVPCKGLEEDNEKMLSEKLKNIHSDASRETIEAWQDGAKQLRAMQEAPDDEESLSSIPLLKREDIDPKSEVIPTFAEEYSACKMLLHPVEAQNISYVNLYFDLSCLSMEELPYVNMLSYLLGKMDTEKYDYNELSNEIFIHTGGIQFDPVIINDYHDLNTYHRWMNVQVKGLTRSFPKMLELMDQIMFHSNFNRPRRIKELVSEMKSGCEGSIHHQGHLVAAKRLNSYFSPAGHWNEQLGGLSFYHFLLDQEPQWANSNEELIHKLAETGKKIFNRSNILVSLTASEQDIREKKKILAEHLEQAPEAQSLTPQPLLFEENIQNEGIMSSSKVQYVLKGYNYKRLGMPYKGSLQVVETLASLDYLWNRIRVMGGAYGGFIKISRSGRIVLGSYRDPQLRKTIDAFDELGAYLRKINLSERELRKYIIGTMSHVDAPLTPSMKACKGDVQYISGVTTEEIQKERDEILSTQLKDIHEMSDWIRACTEKNCFCVMGNESRIKENKDLFGKLTKAFR